MYYVDAYYGTPGKHLTISGLGGTLDDVRELARREFPSAVVVTIWQGSVVVDTLRQYRGRLMADSEGWGKGWPS